MRSGHMLRGVPRGTLRTSTTCRSKTVLKSAVTDEVKTVLNEGKRLPHDLTRSLLRETAVPSFLGRD